MVERDTSQLAARSFIGRIESELKVRSPRVELPKEKIIGSLGKAGSAQEVEFEEKTDSIFAQVASLQFLSKYLCLHGGYQRNIFPLSQYQKHLKKLFQAIGVTLNVADFLNLANAVMAPHDLYYPFFNYLSELLVLNKKILGYSSEVDNAWRFLSEPVWGDFFDKRFLGVKLHLSCWNLCRAYLPYGKPFEKMLWLPGNRCLIAAGKKLFLWDMKNMKVFAGEPLLGDIKSIGADESGAIILLSARGSIQRFELNDEKLTWSFGINLGSQHYITHFSHPHNGHIVWTSEDNLVGMWAFLNNANESVYEDKKEHHVQLMPDGKIIASDKNSIRLIDMVALTETEIFPEKNDLKKLEEKGLVKQLVLSEKGNVLIALLDDDSIVLFKMSNGQFVVNQNFRLRSRKSSMIAKIKAITIAPNERFYAIADSEGSVGVFHVKKQDALLHNVFETDFDAAIESIQFDRNSSLLFVQGLKHKIQVWDIELGDIIGEWITPLGTLIKFFSTSPYEERLVVASGGIKNMMHLLGGSADLTPVSYLLFKSLLDRDGILKPLYPSTWLSLELAKCKDEIRTFIKPATLKIFKEKALSNLNTLKEKEQLKKIEILNAEFELNEAPQQDNIKREKIIKEHKEQQELSEQIESKKRNTLKNSGNNSASIQPKVLSYQSTLCS